MPHLFVNTPSSMSEAGVTEAQKQRLEAAWEDLGGRTPEGAALARLGTHSGLAQAQVRTWFKAKRKREKKKRQKKKAKKAKTSGPSSSSSSSSPSQFSSDTSPAASALLAVREDYAREIAVCTKVRAGGFFFIMVLR